MAKIPKAAFASDTYSRIQVLISSGCKWIQHVSGVNAALVTLEATSSQSTRNVRRNALTCSSLTRLVQTDRRIAFVRLSVSLAPLIHRSVADKSRLF